MLLRYASAPQALRLSCIACQPTALGGSHNTAPTPHLSGKPLVYVSHGDQDCVLRVDYCSRRIVPQLSSRGCNPCSVSVEGTTALVQQHSCHG